MADGRTIQVHGVDPAVVEMLECRAKERGVSLSAYIREWLGDHVARQIASDEWWRNRPEPIGLPLTQKDIDDCKAERDARPTWMP